METEERLVKKLAGSGQAQRAAQFFHRSFGQARPSFFFTVPFAPLSVLVALQSTTTYYRDLFAAPAGHAQRNGEKKLAGGGKRNGE